MKKTTASAPAAREKRRLGTANICFDCDNACGGCSWSAIDPVTGRPQFKPVPGWTATKTKVAVNGTERRYLDTYRITACPQFVKTEKRGELRALTDKENNEFLKNPSAFLEKYEKFYR